MGRWTGESSSYKWKTQVSLWPFLEKTEEKRRNLEMNTGTDLVVAPPKVSDGLPKHLRARLLGRGEVFKVPLRHVLRLCRVRRLLYFGCMLIIISVTELKMAVLLCICLDAGGRFQRLLFLSLFEQPVASEILAASRFHRYTILLWGWANDRRCR